ncbi:MAG: hypothetical protein WKG01_16150 [Kofleriaceae bacterium]
MKRIILLASIALTVFGGTAMADRDDHRGRDRRGPVVRDNRQHNNRGWDSHRDNRRVDTYRRAGWDNRRVVRRAPRYTINRRPVYVNQNRYVFQGGISRVYSRPVIQYRYYNYRVRPQLLVENIEPVPGYIWVSGQWMWNGGEWTWNAGHYAVDPNFQYSQYDYDGDGYADPATYDEQYQY